MGSKLKYDLKKGKLVYSLSRMKEFLKIVQC